MNKKIFIQITLLSLIILILIVILSLYKNFDKKNVSIINDNAKTLNKIRSYQKIHDDKKLQKYFDIDACINDIINNEDPSMTEKHDIEYRNTLFNFY